MALINIYEAKTHLSRLVDQASTGTDVIIGRSGKPLARITQLNPEKPLVQFGVLKGKVKIADDFDAPLPEKLIATFEGR